MSEPAKQPPREFPTTWWTLIDQALADGTTVRHAAVEQIVLRYAPPLRAHLTLRKRLDDELADELLQAFVTEKIVSQYLLRHANRQLGKFRSLLVRSLENFHVDWLRARARQPAAPLADEQSPAAHAGADVFDLAWARQMLDEVLATMRADCQSAGQAHVWGVFECRLLAPTRLGSEPLGYDAVCERFGFASPEQASNVLVTAKRKFQKAFERVAARYCHDGEQADELLRELTAILAQAGPLQWRRVPAVVWSPQPAVPSSQDLDDSQPTLVVRLLDLGTTADDVWAPAELGRLMRHQLDQPLTSLDPVKRLAATPARNAAAAAPLATFADLFRHPGPPLETLEAVKRYGRKLSRQSDATFPVEIASALYFASIAAALVRHGARITKSDDELLRFGFHGMLERPWIESPLRELYAEALARLGPAADATEVVLAD